MIFVLYNLQKKKYIYQVSIKVKTDNVMAIGCSKMFDSDQ